MISCCDAFICYCVIDPIWSFVYLWFSLKQTYYGTRLVCSSGSGEHAVACSGVHAKELKNLHNELRDLQSQRDAALRELSELRGQLRTMEEQRDAVKRELLDISAKLKDGKRLHTVWLGNHAMFRLYCIKLYAQSSM